MKLCYYNKRKFIKAAHSIHKALANGKNAIAARRNMLIDFEITNRVS